MSKICQLTGKKYMKGNHVSFSNKKTKRTFMPNLISKRIFIPEENRWVRLKISTSALKNINKKGVSEVLKEAKTKGFI